MAVGRSLEDLCPVDWLYLFMDMGELFSYSPTKGRYSSVVYNTQIYNANAQNVIQNIKYVFVSFKVDTFLILTAGNALLQRRTSPHN